MSEEPPKDISDADGHLQVAAERAAESKPYISDKDEEDSLDELLKDDTPTRVRDGLWIGSLEAARNYPHLKSQNITHVLQVASIEQEHHPGMEYMVVSVQDENSVDLVTHFVDCFAFIDRGRAAGGVLVHCVAGVSRSATVCLGYLMSHEQLRYPEAWRILQKARPWVNPNEGFQAQLREFERLGADPTRWSRPWGELWGARGARQSTALLKH